MAVYPSTSTLPSLRLLYLRSFLYRKSTLIHNLLEHTYIPYNVFFQARDRFLGADIGGLCVALYLPLLLRHTIPRLRAIDRFREFHLTIVSPNSKCHWNIAAPRALIDDKQILTSNVLNPFSSMLEQFSSNFWQHVIGKVIAFDLSLKTITVSLAGGSQSSLSYNSLIIATGAHYDSPIWTTEHGTTMQKEAFAAIHKSLPKVKSILIAGGEPTGVETAEEIGVNSPKASVTLYSGNSRLLGRNVKPNSSAVAERQLKATGVNIRVSRTGTRELGGWRGPGFFLQMVKGKVYLLNFAASHLVGNIMTRK